MRNRANHLLAALALADIAVFIFMLPTSLSAFQIFYESSKFRIIFANAKPHFAAFANWFSCAAIWIVLAVSVERLLVIKFPFRSLKQYHVVESFIITSVILLVTFILTSYHHFSYRCATLWVCNMTQVYVKCLSITWNWTAFGLVPYEQPSDTFVSYINTSAIANALIGVIIPVFIVAFLNVSLIRLLRIRTQQAGAEESFGPSASTNFHDQERKMTVTVAAIVSCFTISQLPSAILFLYEKLVSDAKTETFAKVSCITNFLVITGKMLNVVLFCLTSVTFRRKLFEMVKNWCGKCTFRQTNLHYSNPMNRSFTQMSTLFSIASIRNQRSKRQSATQAWSLVQLDEKCRLETDYNHKE